MIDKRDFMRRVKTYFHETMIFAYYLLIFQMPNTMHEIDIVAPVIQEIYNLVNSPFYQFTLKTHIMRHPSSYLLNGVIRLKTLPLSMNECN